MECDTVRSHFADRLSGALTDAESTAIEQHLAGCVACRAESDAFADTWLMLGSIDSPAPDSARMRVRFNASVDGFEQGRAIAPSGMHARLAALFPPQWQLHLARAATACALVAIGIVIGHYVAPLSGGAEGTRPTEASSEIVAMRGELHDLREMITLSLMQEQSASERLKGVSWSGQIDRPGSEIVSALLDTLMHDPNVNVRLATIDALERFASQDIVRRGTIAAVDRQSSPLVQIALIDFMVKVNERESIGTLRRLSQDPMVNASVRAHAAWGLQQLG
jgi:hypothetical protein